MKQIQNIEESIPYADRLHNKILTYLSTIWADRRQTNKDCSDWLNNFFDETIDDGKERIHALFLLSKFMYFGNNELRELLRSLYRDLFKYNVISQIRRDNGNTRDIDFISEKFNKELDKTRFLGVGNPSESGVHLLYYFRQENNLSRTQFINAYEVFNKTIEIFEDENEVKSSNLKITLKDNEIKRYVFIDDFSGSGSQALLYSENIVKQIKQLKPDAEVSYLILFATESSIEYIKQNTEFDRVKSIYKIDESFKCFSSSSRYFNSNNKEIDKDFCISMCNKYGLDLFSDHPLGFKDGQLLLSMFHNTPDNSLPIFWSEVNNWQPFFKRFSKLY